MDTDRTIEKLATEVDVLRQENHKLMTKYIHLSEKYVQLVGVHFPLNHGKGSLISDYMAQNTYAGAVGGLSGDRERAK